MERMTFPKLIEQTLDSAKKPLTSREIWEEAEKLGLTKELKSEGKTPWDTIGAYLYYYIKQPDTIFFKYSTRPTRFCLKKYEEKVEEWTTPGIDDEQTTSFPKNEREYHPLLVRFISSEFGAKAKTIFHEHSVRSKKGLTEWNHPDIVAVFFPFGHYETPTIEFQKELASNAVKVYSFELKKELNLTSLKEYYFQAVSNSSWAHEGYLAILKINKTDELMKELGRLSKAFGIGVIELNEKQPEESEIVFPATTKIKLDWDTLNLLVKDNSDFKTFIKDVKNDLESRDGEIRGRYDPINKPEV